MSTTSEPTKRHGTKRLSFRRFWKPALLCERLLSARIIPLRALGMIARTSNRIAAAAPSSLPLGHHRRTAVLLHRLFVQVVLRRIHRLLPRSALGCGNVSHWVWWRGRATEFLPVASAPTKPDASGWLHTSLKLHLKPSAHSMIAQRSMVVGECKLNV